MITIKDIAKELNLSVSTVSMALNNNQTINEKTRIQVQAKARELGYVKNGIAVDLQKKKTNLILLVVDDASRPFFSKTIDATQREVAKKDYNLLIATTFLGHTETAERYISEHRADGAIIYTPRISDDFIIQYATPQFPIFVLGRKIETQNENVLCLSDISVEKANATQYLINHGHKNIAFIMGGKTLGTQRRFKQYQATLAINDIALDENLVFDAGMSSIDAGNDATREMMKRVSNIDAIVYSNDDLAIGGLAALKKLNLNVPEDISIIGHNNLIYSELVTPKLTSVSLPDGIGEVYAVDALINKIEGKSMQEHELIEIERLREAGTKIVERESVKTK